MAVGETKVLNHFEQRALAIIPKNRQVERGGVETEGRASEQSCTNKRSEDSCEDELRDSYKIRE